MHHGSFEEECQEYPILHPRTPAGTCTQEVQEVDGLILAQDKIGTVDRLGSYMVAEPG